MRGTSNRNIIGTTLQLVSGKANTFLEAAHDSCGAVVVVGPFKAHYGVLQGHTVIGTLLAGLRRRQCPKGTPALKVCDRHQQEESLPGTILTCFQDT
jgi:threonine dehydrogenase-like Zn-dependent dehydrogenase